MLCITKLVCKIATMSFRNEIEKSVSVIRLCASRNAKNAIVLIRPLDLCVCFTVHPFSVFESASQNEVLGRLVVNYKYLK